MDKLFHVFVSSTYADLQEERGRVSEGLSKAGQVPEGMEIFPASSQKQIDFIKSVIDRCDYYVVILGGRYGSTSASGTSFTELEYEYAVSKGLPTLAFLRKSPELLDAGKTDSDPDKAARLIALRRKIEQNSLVDYWTAPDQLATKVVAAIAQEISTNPGVGWIRGNRAASEQLLNEINELRKTNDELRAALSSSKPILSVPNLAGIDEQFVIHYEYKTSHNGYWIDGEISLSWRDILKIVGPEFRTIKTSASVDAALIQYLRDILGKPYASIKFSMTDKDLILTQMELLGFMKATVYSLKTGGQGLFHTLTPAGLAEALRLNAVTSRASDS